MHQHTFRVLLAAVLAVCLVGLAAGGRSHRTIHPHRRWRSSTTSSELTIPSSRTPTRPAAHGLSKQNTRATVEDDDAFVRLGLENPNSYAVAFEVQLSEEIVRPATLRHRPRHRHRRRDGRLAGTTRLRGRRDTRASRSSSRPRRTCSSRRANCASSRSWTGEAEQSAETLRERVTTLWEDDRLEQRTYQVTGSEGEIVTVDLENPETGDRIEEWHATYTLAGDEAARPTRSQRGRVSRCSTGRSGTMTAPWTRFRSPSTRPAPSRSLSNRRPPKLGFEMTSYRSSVLDGFEWGPFASTARVTP